MFLQNDKVCQNYHNKKYVISLQWIKKEVTNEVDFLDADKHESSLQTDTTIFDRDS